MIGVTQTNEMTSEVTVGTFVAALHVKIDDELANNSSIRICRPEVDIDLKLNDAQGPHCRARGIARLHLGDPVPLLGLREHRRVLSVSDHPRSPVSNRTPQCQGHLRCPCAEDDGRPGNPIVTEHVLC